MSMGRIYGCASACGGKEKIRDDAAKRADTREVGLSNMRKYIYIPPYNTILYTHYIYNYRFYSHPPSANHNHRFYPLPLSTPVLAAS